jgi:hypothetical protein
MSIDFPDPDGDPGLDDDARSIARHAMRRSRLRLPPE